MDIRDKAQIIKLAREGMQISKIWDEHFPQYDYWEIHFTIEEAGEQSSIGTKRMITNRLNKLRSIVPNEHELLIDEIDGLVNHLYVRYKEDQSKINEARKALDN